MKLLLLSFIVWSASFSSSQKTGSKVLLANQKDVRLLPLENPNLTEIVANKLSQAAACDYIFSKSLVFWVDAADYKKGNIQSLDISKPHQQKNEVIASGMEQPDGLACDWIGDKIYWTDAETKRIEVSELNGSSRKVLIWGNLDQPRAIAVNPHEAYMYWTDWGEVPKIERAGMDGTKREVIVSDHIYWPNGITLDYEENKIYWVDANYHAIYRVDADGANREEVINGKIISQVLAPGLNVFSPLTPRNLTNLSSRSSSRSNKHFDSAKPLGALQHPFAIALYGDKVYWTDWATDSIHSMLKNGSGLPAVIKKEGISPMDLQIYGSERQKPGLNPCGDNNGGCSHLCLLSPDPPFYSCACPTGVKINTDNKTCPNGPGEFLLLARRSDIRLISLDTTDYSDVLIPANQVQHAVAISFDPADQLVYWTDDKRKAIFRTRLNGSDTQSIVSVDVERSDGVAIDWIARNLYWTDTGRNYISVSRLNGEMRKVLIDSGIDEPRAIALDPAVGRMYWSDWGVEPKIEVASMDGSDRKVLVGRDIQWPNGLALDRTNQILYWADARKDRIEMIRFDGTGRSIILSDNLPHVFGLSFLGNFIYWTDWQRRCIERMNVNVRHSRQVVKELPDVYGVMAASTRLPPGTNPCALDNGGCSHLCLYTPQGPKCHCPTGFELSPTLKDCFIPEAFLLISFAKAGGIQKIPLDTAHSNTRIPPDIQVEASFLDFSVEDDQIYWTNAKEMVIMRSYMNGTKVEPFLDIGIGMLEEIGVDWIGRNVFWADSSNNRIEMMHMNKLSRKLVLYKGLESPRSIALDPEVGYIYWSEWGSESRIKRADMNGENVIQINKGTIGRANSLTIDHVSQRLYYVDFDINRIVSSDMDGGRVSDVIRGGASQSISSLTLYGEYVYWSDSKRHLVIRANKNTGRNEDEIQNNLNDIDDVVIYHPSRQGGVTSCSKDGGGCQYLCLSLPQGRSTCACPSHYTLNTDNRTCSAPENFLLFSQTKYLSRVIFQNPNNEKAVVPGRPRLNYRSQKNRARPGPDAVLPVTGIRDACSIDFDPTSNTLFWVDCNLSKIMRSNPDGTQTRVLFQNNSTRLRPYDLAVDIYSKRLFWTEVNTNTIRMMKFDGTDVGVVLKGKVKPYGRKEIEIQPRKIAVDSFRGHLYFSNACDNSNSCRTKIMRSAVDGSDCIVLFSRGIKNVTAVAVDSVLEKLYWADQTKIESSNVDGAVQKTLVDTKLSLVTGLAVFGPDLYWVDSGANVLEGANKEDGSGRRTIQSRLKNLRDLVSVTSVDNEMLDNHPCSLDNGGCSHICVIKDDHTTRCSCPDHLVLEDQFECKEPSTCGPNFFTCKRSRECLPASWVCDKDPECKDGSDEEDCPKQIPLSCKGKFSCGFEDLDSLHPLLESIPQCIELSRKCDGKKDCLNGKDEKDCYTPSTSSSSVKDYVVPLSIVGAVVLLLGILGLLKYCMSHHNNSFPSGVVMFTSNENGHFNVEFQSHDDASVARTSVIRGNRKKRPLMVSIVPPPTVNSSVSQAGTSRSGWPVHNDGRWGERPKLSGASRTSSYKRYSGACHTALESCAEDMCSSSGVTSFHESCSGCKRSQRIKRYRKSAVHGAPPPTPCTTDTCEDFEKCHFRSVDCQVLPSDPPPPYYHHHNCCPCCQQHNHCHASSSIDTMPLHRLSSGNPPSYDRLRSNRRRHYHRRYAGMTSDSDPCPPPPTPRSQYMSECCDTTEVEDAHEVEILSTRTEGSEREDDEETVLLAPSHRSSPSATEMSYSTLYNPPPSPVSER